MKTQLKLILVSVLCIYGGASFGHERAVHRQITENAADSAAAASLNYSAFINVVSGDNFQMSDARQYMSEGSFQEDNLRTDEGGFRSLNHFYDPLTRLGLSNIPLDDRLKDTITGQFVSVGKDSFTWASTLNCPGIDIYVEGIGLNANTRNIWAWQNARDYEWHGLTEFDPAARRHALANTFRGVGQVMHLLEDTTSPQHVRNEQHLPYLHLPFNEPSPFEDYGGKHENSLNYEHGILDWRNAGFTKLEDFWNRHLYNGNAAALDADKNENPDGGPDSLGLAEWCNGNFLGQRHIYAEYFKPGDVQYYPLPSLINTVQGRNFNGSLLASLDTRTLENLVEGEEVYIEKDGAGIHMQHHSVLKYLGVRHPPRMARPEMRAMLTINDPNVLQEYHQYLIPRAVEYSAGLLDYFFRGTLDVSVMDLGGGTCQMTIKNTLSQDFKGGAFHLFYDNGDGFRTELTDADFSAYSGALAVDATTTANFNAQAMATNYVLIYQGTIGTTDDQPSDPVDDSIAIAAKNLIGWANDEQSGAVSCYGGGTRTATVEAGTIYSLISKADANARALASAQSQAQSQCPCKSGDSLTLDDAAWMPYFDPYNGQLSADGWLVSDGKATFDSTESELGGLIYYNNRSGISQIICVPTSGYKIRCHISGSSQAGDALIWCAGPGFGFYFNQWGGIFNFDSEADLSVGSNEIAFKVLGSPYGEGPIHVEINFEMIAP
jgi:hypothetical protein